MDINLILNQLREERAQLEEAIIALERMSSGSGKRRGRPPKWIQAAKSEQVAAPKRRGRPRKNGSSDAA